MKYCIKFEGKIERILKGKNEIQLTRIQYLFKNLFKCSTRIYVDTIEQDIISNQLIPYT